jgi:hypothetical protein
MLWNEQIDLINTSISLVIIFSGENIEIHSLSNFQVHNTLLLTAVTMLYN